MTLDIEIQLYLQSGPFPNEDAFQIATAGFLDTLMAKGLLAYYHASPNCYRRALIGKRGQMAAIKAGVRGKRMGIKAGIPDIVIWSHRAAIELKVGKGRLTPEQGDYFSLAKAWSWRCFLARSPNEVIDVLGEIGVLEH